MTLPRKMDMVLCGLKLGLRSCPPAAVASRKDMGEHEGDAFVAIDKGVIADDAVGIGRRQSAEIGIVMGGKMPGAGTCGARQSAIPKTRGTTVLGEQTHVQRLNHCRIDPDNFIRHSGAAI